MECIICNESEKPNDKLRTPSAGVGKIQEYGEVFHKSGVLQYLEKVNKENLKIHASCQKQIGNDLRREQRKGKK